MFVDGLKISESDVRELSREWRSVVQSVDYASAAIALRILAAMVRSYLRGHGCRMGNRQGLMRHFDKATTLTTAVIIDATDQFADMMRFHEGIESFLRESIGSELAGP